MADLDNNADVLLVRQHFVQNLGQPDEVVEVRGNPVQGSAIQKLQLAYFAPSGPGSPVVFATCGACQGTMKDGRRVEGIIVLRQEPAREAFASIHRLLCSFASFAEANEGAIRTGDVIRSPEELRQFSTMDAILFLPPVTFAAGFRQVALTSGSVADVVWLLPVYESEAAYALLHGPQALLLLFAAQGLNLTEMTRDEANTLIAPEDAAKMAADRDAIEAKKAAEASQDQSSAAPWIKPTRPRTAQPASFETVQASAEMLVVRRTEKPKKPRPPAENAAGVVVDAADRFKAAGEAAAAAQETSKGPSPAPKTATKQTEPENRKAQPGRGLAASRKEPEPPKRFDLSKGAVGGLARKTQSGGASKALDASKAEETAKVVTPVAAKPLDPAEAKRKKIEELKAKARAAAERSRAKGAPPGRPANPADPADAARPANPAKPPSGTSGEPDG